MNTRTWLMMVIVLGINWGGFVGALVYSIVRQGSEDRRREDD